MTATTDEKTIRELHEGFLAANRTGETKFLRDHMAPGPDALLWYNMNQSNYIGVDHICELWDMLRAALVDDKPALVAARDERITIVGDAALVTYLLKFSAELKPPIGKWEQDARTTEVWQRSGGQWKMIHFHCSNYVPGVMGGK